MGGVPLDTLSMHIKPALRAGLHSCYSPSLGAPSEVIRCVPLFKLLKGPFFILNFRINLQALSAKHLNTQGREGSSSFEDENLV